MQMFSGKDYLRIDIASNFGLDKKTWDERIAWFNENEPKLDSLIKSAETPALFYAGVQAWKATLRGEASGYPVSFDATSSGLQFLAILSGDYKAAQICNVINNGNLRADAYKIIYKAMLKLLSATSRSKGKMLKMLL